jgi:adenine-specific DNA-methyltransferase
MLNLTTKSDPTALVLDFFAGSGTTGQAVCEMNLSDGGSRRYILVQLPELIENSTFTIAELTKERLRRVGKKINLDSAENLDLENLDIGFRVLKIDSSNMKEVFYTPDAVSQDLLTDQVNNIREDRTSEDLLFQVLLDWGVDLALPIAQETMAGKEVFFVDGNALAACFETGVNEEFVKLLAKRQPLRVVFRDAGFASDSVKINVEQIFKLMSPGTEVKTI